MTRKLAATKRPSVLPDPSGLARDLLRWYDAHKRDLPWRRTADPYAVWVSEVMLQQTQVATVRGYYERWMKRFPTIAALASAPEDDVLHTWQGLGYYSRARNLQKGAKAVVSEHGGKVPRTVTALRTLPGVGPYSAGAIASIAHGERAAIVDGNVVRVLCRLFGLRGDPTREPLKADLWRLAEAAVPEARPGDFNQAMMELGATICVPRHARCDECPLAGTCVARKGKIVEELPELPKRRAVIAMPRAATVVFRGERVLVVKAEADAPRWAGMWQFPSSDVVRAEGANVAAERAVRETVGLVVRVGEPTFTVRHSVTHHRITLEVFRTVSRQGAPRPVRCDEFAWKRPSELPGLAMPAAHRRIAGWLSSVKAGR
ncbi:MAG TPA: A/G-specific adenine glycosylase [Polyangiaceae bacterium]